MNTVANTVTRNEEQKLFVIPCQGGYSCLGFAVCYERATKLAQELEQPLPIAPIGSIDSYYEYQALLDTARGRHNKTGWRSESELIPQLKGLEGTRVEVVNCWGETQRFWVGKSTGFVPCHLEIKTRRSTGGCAVVGAPFRSVRMIAVK